MQRGNETTLTSGYCAGQSKVRKPQRCIAKVLVIPLTDKYGGPLFFGEREPFRYRKSKLCRYFHTYASKSSIDVHTLHAYSLCIIMCKSKIYIKITTYIFYIWCWSFRDVSVENRLPRRCQGGRQAQGNSKRDALKNSTKGGLNKLLVKGQATFV